MALIQRKFSQFLMGEQRLAMGLNGKTKAEASSTKDIKKLQAGRQDHLLGISFPNTVDKE